MRQFRGPKGLGRPSGIAAGGSLPELLSAGLALVSAGFALGLTGEAHISTSREAGVVARPLASRVPPLTTYLLRLEGDPSDEISRFIERVKAIQSPESPKHRPDSPGALAP